MSCLPNAPGFACCRPWAWPHCSQRFSWFGYFRLVPDWLRLASVALFAVGFAASLLAFRGLRWPGREPALDRLETDNRIIHQALAVQSDELKNDDEFARSLWQVHQKRMAEQIEAIHVPPPRPDTPRVDPFGLRAVVVLLLVVAFSFSYSNQSGRLGDAFHAHVPVTEVVGTRIDAWVTPPDYTGKAPIFLTSNTRGLPETIPVPEGSEILVRIVGGAGSEEVVFDTGGEQLSIAENEQPADGKPKDGNSQQIGTRFSF